MSSTSSDNGLEIERIAQDIAETEFLASVEVTAGAARIMDWLESLSSIQRRRRLDERLASDRHCYWQC